MKEKILDWVSNNKKEFYLLSGILSAAAFFRLYRISEYMTFLGDEGRDVIIVRKLLTEADPILIGPGTSIGNMYLGPLYYYFMAPGLLLANFSPVGPAISVALLGIATVFLIWFVAREWFGKSAAAITAFLYAIAPTVIIFSRSSWNPNIMPFFALLTIYSIWRVWQHKEFWWLTITGISLAFSLQSHYLALVLAPVLGIYWLLAFKSNYSSLDLKNNLIKHTLLGAIIFLLLMSPLVIFDFRHGFINYNSMKLFFTERQTTVSAKPWSALPNIWPLWQDITTRLLAGRDVWLGKWFALILLSAPLLLIKSLRNKYEPDNWALGTIVTISWLGFALLGLGVFKQHIYDHYYGFFFPAPFLLFGSLSSYLISKAKIRGWWLVGTMLVFLTYFNLLDNPLRFAPNRQYQRSVAVAEKIATEAAGEPFNLAVVAQRNYEDAYQYFLEKDNAGVVDIDAQRTSETITKQLFVVCEMPVEKCDPTNSPKAEVANFGWTKIEETWNVQGITIFKLVHSR